MKKLLSLHTLFLLLSVAFLAACSDGNEDNPQAAAPAIEWAAGQNSPTFETTGGSTAVHFSSTTDWTAEVDQDWCSVTPARGVAGEDCMVTVSATANESTDERNATLIVRSGNVVQRLTIVQKQKDALTVTSGRIEVSAEGGEVTVEVQSNITFEYTIDEAAADWLTPVETRSLTTHQLHFQVAANDGVEKREGQIVFHSGQLSETVTVYQDGGEPQLLLTRNAYTVASEGETITIEVRSNVPYEMRMPAGVDWLSETIGTRAMSTYTRYIEVDPNENYDLRSAQIVFVSEEQGLADTVTITQVQKDAILVAQPVYMMRHTGGTLEFAVNTNVEFQVELDADWIHQDPRTRALQEVPLRFTVDPNTDAEGREATITFKSTTVTQTVTVRQSPLQEESVLLISYTGASFKAPLLGGTYFAAATVAWGDGQSEAYKEDLTHTYETEGSYTVTVRSEGAESFALDDLVGVTELDLSGF